MDISDAAVADEHLLTVDHPVRAVLARPRLDRADVAATARLCHRECGELDVARGPEALRRPLRELLVGGRLADGRERERWHHDRQADSRATPEQLLHQDRQRQASGIRRQLGIELPAVQILLRGLLQHWPRKRLLAVVLGSNWTDDLTRE